jgi:hypothetical protein
VAKTRVKVNKAQIEKFLKGTGAKLRKAIAANASKKIPKILKREIINEHILKGKSPVAGIKRYVRYSESYRRQINSSSLLRGLGKKPTPVNLKVSGVLLESFNVKSTSKGLTVGFSDKVAAFHQLGRGNNPQRQMLPGPGQTFKRQILRSVNEGLIKIIKKAIRVRKIKAVFGF